MVICLLTPILNDGNSGIVFCFGPIIVLKSYCVGHGHCNEIISSYSLLCSGQGYKNGAVCVFVCVCVSVCEHSHGWMDWHTITKFGTGIYLDGIWDEFDVQGQRSRVKVTRSKNLMSMIFWLQCQYAKCWPVVWHYDVMWCHGMESWRHGMIPWHHSMTSSVFLLWDKFIKRKVFFRSHSVCTLAGAKS